jgi:penicillin-binding protein 1A
VVSKKKSKSKSRLNLYSNLSHKRKTKKDAESRKRAEYLATLPKHPIKRFFYRLHPKRVAKYWFSKRGGIMALKILGVIILLVLLTTGALFAYFRKDLNQIRPGELAKRVQTTVTKYYDRNGELLWEDTGEENYKLVVESDELSEYLKQATVAIEDKDFYNHHGVSFSGIMRAIINNLTSNTVQGGSTLTQQLVKQVFFADEAAKRGLSGVPRKIKEVILAVEIERMYDKDQILTLYINESPYGGRRNGAESAAQTYFGKSAKDLTLAEAALLAAIPQNPSVYNPYNIKGHESLISRQHTVLDSMVEQGYVTRSEADGAKKVAIIDTLKPEADQYANIKAPHFVQMVRSELVTELGEATVGRGGLIVTTTLDLRIQKKAEEAINDMFNSYVPNWAGFTNAAATVEDSQTGQILALVGSRDFNYPGFGQDNAATAFIQPGSSIKPLVYAQLFENKGSNVQNYGSGTVLKDENIDNIYGAKLQNADKAFWGDLTIRKGLATSRNIPAVKAMYISGVEPTLATIRKAGNTYYCTQGTESQVGLASAIGGCGTRQVDHVNAYATLARGGIYKEQSSILEVKNSSGEVLNKWKDSEGKRVISDQAAYIVTDILSDDNARSALVGRNALGLNISGVRTAAKTGTSDKDGYSKDVWMMSYSPAITMGVWLGNPDGITLRNGSSLMPGPIVAAVMEYSHKSIYATEGKWKAGDWFTQPSGIQVVGNELYPAWWNKNQGQSDTKLIFDRLSKYKATDCTPEGARIELDVKKSIDPVTKKEIFIAPDGYDATKEDDRHQCSDAKPSVTSIDFNKDTSDKIISVTVIYSQGTFGLSTLEVKAGGTVISSISISSSGSQTIPYKDSQPVTATVTDQGYYTATKTVSPPEISGDD